MEIWFDRLTEGLSLARDEVSATSVLARLTAEAGYIPISSFVPITRRRFPTILPNGKGDISSDVTPMSIRRSGAPEQG